MKRWNWIKFLGIELDRMGIKEMVHEFPWKDVDACMGNVVEPPIEGMKVVCPKCGKELHWIRFRSPAWTWENLIGREGPLAICEDCHKQVYFKCELMN